MPGIQTLVASMLPVGFAFGALEVALPAFAHDEGRPELAGVLVALWAFGQRDRRADLRRAHRGAGRSASVHLRVALLLPLSFLPLALAGSPAVMAVLVAARRAC